MVLSEGAAANLGPRQARAQTYFDQDLRKQREWYSTRSSQFKSRTQVLAMAIIAAGALTTFVQIFDGQAWVPVLTAMLGAFVALTEGWQRISRYGETWLTYRIASERMKRERRLFENGAGVYRELTDEAAFVQFVENVEAIIAEEQQIYWQARQPQGGDAKSGTDGEPQQA